MTLLSKLNTNILVYTGMILVILNAIFLDFNLFINILGFALILFSSSVLKLIGNFLKDNHQLIIFFLNKCLLCLLPLLLFSIFKSIHIVNVSEEQICLFRFSYPAHKSIRSSLSSHRLEEDLGRFRLSGTFTLFSCFTYFTLLWLDTYNHSLLKIVACLTMSK